MKRSDVYRIVDGEREYQDTIRKKNELETMEDEEKSVADFILYIEEQLNEAKRAHYKLKDPRQFIRKIIGLGVACGEAFGLPERKV